MKYSLKHRVVSWISRNLFDSITYTVHNGLNKGLRRRGGLGWLPFEQTNAEIEFWKSLDLTDKVVYDIGAFHGLLTIHFARQAKQVVAWEPTSRNRNRLLQNIEANSFRNVIVRPYGLGSRCEESILRFDENAPGTASVNSTLGSGGITETVEVRTLDLESGLPAPDFVKIDTEGNELDVLLGGRHVLESKPDLFLEMHGADSEDKGCRVEAIVTFLEAAGYTSIRHIESGAMIGSGNARVAREGHLYARSLPLPA